jgi:SAM-dependent methyltransferase
MSGPLAAARPLAKMLTRRLRRWQNARRPKPGTLEDIDPATLAPDTRFAFRCNLCGTESSATLASLDRDSLTCAFCSSNVRFRAMAHLVVREIFGEDIALPQVPVNKTIKGLGLSDADAYAIPLAAKFDYINTYFHTFGYIKRFFHTEPRLDIADTDVDVERYGGCDFIVASDVFEHVAPPVSRAFVNARRLLKPGGRLIFTVPFTLDGDTVEHFTDLHDWRVDEHQGRWRLTNRAVDGRVTHYDDLVFHGGPGTTLEMRVFSRDGLLREFERAGFTRVRIAAEPYLPFGIHWPEPWSVPLVAYR